MRTLPKLWTAAMMAFRLTASRMRHRFRQGGYWHVLALSRKNLATIVDIPPAMATVVLGLVTERLA